METEHVLRNMHYKMLLRLTAKYRIQKPTVCPSSSTFSLLCAHFAFISWLCIASFNVSISFFKPVTSLFFLWNKKKIV